MKTVIIADDHALTLLGIKEYVSSLGYKVIDTCSNGITAFNLILSQRPDIAILDISMPGLTGLEILCKLYEQRNPTKVILVTMHKESSIFKKALACGVSGFILKEQANESLEKCLYEISIGNSFFSEDLQNDLSYTHESDNDFAGLFTLTELKILKLISERKTSKQISESLFSSEKTIEGHRRNIIQKLGLPKEKNTLLIWAMENREKFYDY